MTTATYSRIFISNRCFVAGVPEGYSAEKGRVERMVSDLILILASGVKGALKETMTASMAEKFAFLGAAGSSQPLSALQIAGNRPSGVLVT